MVDMTSLPKERRRHSRTSLQMTLTGIRLDPDGGDVVSVLQMLDISRSGIGALSDRTFYPGQRVVLSLPAVQTARRRNVYATVTRCAHDREGGYRVGMEFDSISAASVSPQDRAVTAAA